MRILSLGLVYSESRIWEANRWDLNLHSLTPKAMSAWLCRVETHTLTPHSPVTQPRLPHKCATSDLVICFLLDSSPITYFVPFNSLGLDLGRHKNKKWCRMLHLGRDLYLSLKEKTKSISIYLNPHIAEWQFLGTSILQASRGYSRNWTFGAWGCGWARASSWERKSAPYHPTLCHPSSDKLSTLQYRTVPACRLSVPRAQWMTQLLSYFLFSWASHAEIFKLFPWNVSPLTLLHALSPESTIFNRFFVTTHQPASIRFLLNARYPAQHLTRLLSSPSQPHWKVCVSVFPFSGWGNWEFAQGHFAKK